MGVDVLGKSSSNPVRFKLVLRDFTPQQARRLLDKALEKEDGFAIHRLLSGVLGEAGVYGY